MKLKKEPQKPEWPDRLHIRKEFIRAYRYDHQDFVGYESEDEIHSGCVGVYQLVDVHTIRQVRVVEPGCKEMK